MPNPQLLETFVNPYPGREYEIHMVCPEFTSLCPLGGVESDATDLKLLQGGAPDFATISITYVPGDRCVELKSLKYYVTSYRNVGTFQEHATARIAEDLFKLLEPQMLEVTTLYNVRGGFETRCTVRFPND